MNSAQGSGSEKGLLLGVVTVLKRGVQAKLPGLPHHSHSSKSASDTGKAENAEGLGMVLPWLLHMATPRIRLFSEQGPTGLS